MRQLEKIGVVDVILPREVRRRGTFQSSQDCTADHKGMLLQDCRSYRFLAGDDLSGILADKGPTRDILRASQPPSSIPGLEDLQGQLNPLVDNPLVRLQVLR